MPDEIWRKSPLAEQAALFEPHTARCEGRNDFSPSLSKRGKIARLCTERGH
jgi:hypothetical protein